MITRRCSLVVLLSIATLETGRAEEKDGKFRVQPAASYRTKQTQAGLTIAAIPFTTGEQLKPVYGKLNLNEYGVLPILIVMSNDSGKTLRMDALEVTYVTSERRNIDSTPAADVRYLEGAQRPNIGPGRNPFPIPRNPVKKSKLNVPEIEGHAFNAKMIPAGDKAHGFVYFQTGHRPGSMVYIRGIVEAPSGKELLFFEIPLD